ncbi:PilZ domain-containing protein [Chlamydiota bacterium]
MASLLENEKKQKPDRRQALRTKIALPIEIEKDEKKFSTKTIDVSRLGASCIINNPIPEFSLINTKIKFPNRENEKKTILIEVPGIIVNCRRVSHTRKQYRIGFYYDDISNEFQKDISDIIKYLKKIIRKEKREQKKEEVLHQEEHQDLYDDE